MAVTSRSTPATVVDQFDPDTAEYIISIQPSGWYAVPQNVPQWMADCPELCAQERIFGGGDPCD